MPSSRPNSIPLVINLVRNLKPQSILDVGIGFGKWGHLFREYTDINASENSPELYYKDNWQVRIDGIEGYPPYITDMHRFLYNDIYEGDVRDVVNDLKSYDIIFLGDIIEHFNKDQGQKLLEKFIKLSNKVVIVTTPEKETHQSDLCGNELERHRSLWSANDFQKFNGSIVDIIEGDMIIAAFAKPSVFELTFRIINKNKIDAAFKDQVGSLIKEIDEKILPDANFILVDEDQIRSGFDNKPRAKPFMEKNGEYWGPPSNDEAAISEIKRTRNNGADYLVITFQSFWWLEYYKQWHQYLRSTFKCILENERLVIFDLREAFAGN